MKKIIFLSLFLFAISCEDLNNINDQSMNDQGMNNAMISIRGLEGVADPGDKINFVIFARSRASIACATAGEIRPLVERANSNEAPELDMHQYREYAVIGSRDYSGSSPLDIPFRLPEAVSEEIFNLYQFGFYITAYIEKSGDDGRINKGDITFLNRNRDPANPIESEALGYDIMVACYNYVGLGGLGPEVEIDFSENAAGTMFFDVRYQAAVTPIFLWSTNIRRTAAISTTISPATRSNHAELILSQRGLCPINARPAGIYGVNTTLMVHYSSENPSLNNGLGIPYYRQRPVMGPLNSADALDDPDLDRAADLNNKLIQRRYGKMFDGQAQTPFKNNLLAAGVVKRSGISMTGEGRVDILTGANSTRRCNNWSSNSLTLSASRILYRINEQPPTRSDDDFGSRGSTAGCLGGGRFICITW